MGFFGSGDKTTLTSNTQLGASDNGQIISGPGASSSDGSQSISANGFSTVKYGSTEIGGPVLSNSLYGSTNNGTITYGIGTDDVTKLLSDATNGIANVVKQQTDAAAAQVSGVVSGLQDLALSKQTNGESNRDNTILWIVGLAIAGLAAILLGGKRA